MNKIFSILIFTCIVLAGCGTSDKPGEGEPVYEPAYKLTEEQKDEGGYSFSVTGPVIKENFEYTSSDGSRAIYNRQADMTRILARDENNPKTTLMVDFKGSNIGTYPLNTEMGKECSVIIGVANSDGTMRFSGMLSHSMDGELRITELKQGGYAQGEFKGVTKIENQPHEIKGKFKVRMRGGI
jgi:hypothetical protein